MLRKIEDSLFSLFLKLLPKRLRQKLSNSAGAKKIFASIIHLFSEKGLRLTIGIFTYSMVVRHLGPSEYGNYSLILSYVAFVVPFTHFGLEEVLSRDLVNSENDPKQSGSVVWTSILVKAINTILGVLLLTISIYFFKYPKELKILTLVYGSFVILKSLDSFDIFFQSQLNVRRLSFARNVGYLSATLAKLLGVYMGFGLSFFVFTHCLELLVSKVAILTFYRRSISVFKISFKKNYAIKLWSEAFPMFLVIFGMVATDRITPVLIERLLGAKAVGEYGAAMGLVDIWIFFPAVVSASFFPSMVKSFDDKTIFVQKVQSLSNILVWLAIIICIFGVILGPTLLPILFGKRFINSTSVFNWLIWSQVFTYFNWVKFKWFSLEGRLKELLLGYVIAIAFQILSLVFFIDFFGVKVGGISILIGHAISFLLMSLLFSTSRNSMIVFCKSLCLPFMLLKKNAV